MDRFAQGHSRHNLATMWPIAVSLIQATRATFVPIECALLSQTKQRHLSRTSEGYEGNVAKLIDRLRSSWRIIVALRGAMRYKTQTLGRGPTFPYIWTAPPIRQSTSGAVAAALWLWSDRLQNMSVGGAISQSAATDLRHSLIAEWAARSIWTAAAHCIFGLRQPAAGLAVCESGTHHAGRACAMSQSAAATTTLVD